MREQKRTSNNKKRYGTKRGSGRGLLLLPVVIVLIAAAFLLLNNVFVVRNVIVGGDAALTETDVARLSGLRFGTSIFRIDAEEIRQNVESSGEYILEEIRVQRPNSVYLSINRRLAVAVVFSGGQYLSLDERAVVVRIEEKSSQEELVFVKGMNPVNYRLGRPIAVSSDQSTAYTALMSSMMRQDALPLIKEIDFSDLMHIRGMSSIGVSVEFGDAENIEDKIVWMKAALLDLAARGDTVGLLDVSSGTQAQWRAA